MENFYLNKLENLKKNREVHLSLESKYSYLRLISFSALFIHLFIFRENLQAVYIGLPLVLIVFISFVYKHMKTKEKRKEIDAYIDVFSNEIGIINGEDNIYSNGSVFSDSTHPYTSDLDIFGEKSIFQYINRSSTSNGLHILAKWLKSTSDTKKINERQKTVKELSKDDSWMFKFLTNSIHFSANDLFNLKQWFTIENYFVNPKSSLLIHYFVPVIFFFFTYLSYSDTSYLKFLFLIIIVNSIIFNSFRKKIRNLYQKTDQLHEYLKLYSKLLKTIEEKEFEDSNLKGLKSKIYHHKQKPSKIIFYLSDIIFKLNYRNSMMGGFLNITILWEMIYVAKLEIWKHKYGESVLNWLEAIGEFEALVSLGVLTYNHKNWNFPEITDEISLIGEELGHPLIKEKQRVMNPATINKDKNLVLITGSNMAGKSTYQRTIGINHVLALAGAPICGKSYKTPNIGLFTYMRIKDSIEDQTSTFYAEIKRLKSILDEVKKNKPVLILLDEILRGTNSRDKHAGSQAVIEELIKTNSLTFVATHDLKLSELEKKHSNIRNVYFDIEVIDDQLLFDYKVKDGVCNTMNASLLLKKIGIHIN